MNKKQLFQTNEKLFSLLDTNKKEIEILNKKLNELNTLLKAKDFEIEELKKQNGIKKELHPNSVHFENSDLKPNLKNTFNDFESEDTFADIKDIKENIEDIKDIKDILTENIQTEQVTDLKEEVKSEIYETNKQDETDKTEEPIENNNTNTFSANNDTFKKIEKLSDSAISLKSCSLLPEKYVAETISKVSYKAALIYNELKTDSNISKEYANELLTLTLGKIELFKSSAYELLNQNLNPESLSENLKALEAETVNFLSDIHLKINNL